MMFCKVFLAAIFTALSATLSIVLSQPQSQQTSITYSFRDLQESNSDILHQLWLGIKELKNPVKDPICQSTITESLLFSVELY